MHHLTLSSLKQAARRYNSTVTGGVIGNYAKYDVEAPEGTVWACTGDVHALVLTWWVDERGRPQWPQEKHDAIKDAIERMTYGLTTCNDPECDYCHLHAGDHDAE